MKEWWWSSQLMALGHVFRGTEWRCADCRIRVIDLLYDRPRCESPDNDGQYIFVGGPLDGEWRREASVTVVYPLPFGPPMAISADTNGGENHVSVTYERSKMPRKGMVRYEFRA